MYLQLHVQVVLYGYANEGMIKGDQKMVITWRTNKVQTGYRYQLITVEYQKPSVVLQEGVLSTRARAVSKAKQWKRYYNRKEQAA